LQKRPANTPDDHATEGGSAIRVDNGTELLPAHRTREGFLFAEARATRPGVLVYRRGDGTTVRELIPPEELQDRAVLASLGGKPVTREHPIEGIVTVDTAARDAVGSLMDEVVYDEADGFVKVRMIVHQTS
jgi:hypothetical protein